MSNSAPKHLENSQRCCFFAFVYVGTHQHGERPGCWGRPAIGQAPYFPWPAGCLLPRPDQAERERERVKGLSALPHYKLIPTLAARHIRKDQLGMCFPAISTTERTQANREASEKPREEWIQDGGGALPCICISALQTRSQIWLMETGLAKS